MNEPSPLRALAALGQSVWLDYVERGFVRGGGLLRLIEQDGVSGVTSNPAIFHKAITEHRTYDEAIAKLARDGLLAHEIHEALIIEDIREVADLLRSTYQRTAGRDGFVSLEVSPHLARKEEDTYWEAKRLWALVDRSNVMIKVPGTPEGVAALRRLIADGLNVNVTLLFSVARYAQVADAWVAGLEDRLERDLPIDRVASVASFFLSRIDTLVDRYIDTQQSSDLEAMRGTCALASAQAAYEKFQALATSARWKRLEASGARLQRLLWASTGTKDPAYSDVKYVDALIGLLTITTMPPETLAAFRNHGSPQSRLTEAAQGASTRLEALIARLAQAGLDWEGALDRLERDGIGKFVEPHEATLAALRNRLKVGAR